MAGGPFVPASTSPTDRTYDDSTLRHGVTNSFTGTSKLWALSGVLKWAPNGNATDTNFKLQGEYFRRKENGDLTFDTLTGAALTDGYTRAASRAGTCRRLPVHAALARRLRYDALISGTTTHRPGRLRRARRRPTSRSSPSYNPKRHTAMVDWSPSEFSRVRLQFARDHSREGETDNQFFLQYIMSLGAHGAHNF